MAGEDFGRIEFKHMLDNHEMTDLLNYFRRELSARVEYHGEFTGRLGVPNAEDAVFEERTINEVALHLKGRRLRFTLMPGDTRDGETACRYRGIQFDIPEGYCMQKQADSHFANPADMDRVREITTRYFDRFLI